MPRQVSCAVRPAAAVCPARTSPSSRPGSLSACCAQTAAGWLGPFSVSVLSPQTEPPPSTVPQPRADLRALSRVRPGDAAAPRSVDAEQPRLRPFPAAFPPPPRTAALSPPTQPLQKDPPRPIRKPLHARAAGLHLSLTSSSPGALVSSHKELSHPLRPLRDLRSGAKSTALKTDQVASLCLDGPGDLGQTEPLPPARRLCSPGQTTAVTCKALRPGVLTTC